MSKSWINNSTQECRYGVHNDKNQNDSSNMPINIFHLLTILLIILDEFRNNLFHSTNNHVVGNLVDRRIRIAVHRDDDARVLHTSDVLNLSRDTAGDVNLGVNSHTCLTNLTVVVEPACIDSSTRTTNLAMQHLS